MGTSLTRAERRETLVPHHLTRISPQGNCDEKARDPVVHSKWDRVLCISFSSHASICGEDRHAKDFDRRFLFCVGEWRMPPEMPLVISLRVRCSRNEKVVTVVMNNENTVSAIK